MFRVCRVLLLLLMLCFAPAVSAQVPDSSCDGTLPIVRYAQFQVYDPVYVGAAMGLFEARGVCVEFIGDTLAGPTAIQAVASGRADAALSSIPALINAVAAGLPVIGIADIQSAVENQPLEYFFVRSDSDIQSVEDVYGKTWAVNLWRSSFHYTALMAMAQHNIPEEGANFVLLPFGGQADALAAGEVDIIGLIDPYAAAALRTYPNQFRELFTAADTFGNRQFSLIFINTLWAQYNSEIAYDFAAGLYDAQQYVLSNPDESRLIVSQYTGLSIEDIPAYYFQPDGAVIPEDIEFWLDFMRRRGDLPDTAHWVTADMIGTNVLNPVLGSAR